MGRVKAAITKNHVACKEAHVVVGERKCVGAARYCLRGFLPPRLYLPRTPVNVIIQPIIMSPLSPRKDRIVKLEDRRMGIVGWRDLRGNVQPLSLEGAWPVSAHNRPPDASRGGCRSFPFVEIVLSFGRAANHRGIHT